MLLIKRAASECETKPTLELSKRPALTIVRRAHHRRCAREGLTGQYNALKTGLDASYAAETHRSPGCRFAPTAGLKLANAFGVRFDLHRFAGLPLTRIDT